MKHGLDCSNARTTTATVFICRAKMCQIWTVSLILKPEIRTVLERFQRLTKDVVFILCVMEVLVHQ